MVIFGLVTGGTFAVAGLCAVVLHFFPSVMCPACNGAGRGCGRCRGAGEVRQRGARKRLGARGNR